MIGGFYMAKRKEALRNTYRKRKELLDNADLSKEDDKYLKEISVRYI